MTYNFEIKLFPSQEAIEIQYVEETFSPTDNTGITIYDKYKISIMLSDGMLVVFDDIATYTQKGDFVIFSPDQSHFAKILDTKMHKFLNIFIPINYFDNFSVDTGKIVSLLEHKCQANLISQSSDKREKLIKLANPIVKKIMENQEINTIDTYSKILNILMVLSDFCADNKQEELKNDIPSCVARTLNYISENFSSPISLKQLAKHSYCSVAYLCKTFKQYTGCTVYEQLTNYRILNAKILLRNGKNVTETCYECGFGDCSHFIKTFKAITGITPNHYKITSSTQAE